MQREESPDLLVFPPVAAWVELTERIHSRRWLPTRESASIFSIRLMLVQILVADGRHVRELHLPRLEPLLGRDGVGRLRGLGPLILVSDRKSDLAD